MRRSIIVAAAAVLFCLPFMLWGQAKQFPQDYTEAVTVAATDLFLIVTGGGKITQKIQAANLLKKSRSCEVVFGNPNSSTALADGDDAPVTCGNVSGSDQVITAVACYADAGTPSVNPILTGGSATSILSSVLNCGAGSWAAGAVNGTPTLKTFSANGGTCSVTPCTLNTNIATAGGTAKYAVVRFTILGQ